MSSIEEWQILPPFIPKGFYCGQKPETNACPDCITYDEQSIHLNYRESNSPIAYTCAQVFYYGSILGGSIRSELVEETKSFSPRHTLFCTYVLSAWGLGQIPSLYHPQSKSVRLLLSYDLIHEARKASPSVQEAIRDYVDTVLRPAAREEYFSWLRSTKKSPRAYGLSARYIDD